MQTKRPSSNFTTGNVPVFPAVLVKVPLLPEENAIRFTSSAKKRVLSLPLNSPKKTPASYRVTLPIKKPPSSKAIASPKATTPPTMKNDNSTVNRMFFMIIHLFVLFGFSSVKKKSNNLASMLLDVFSCICCCVSHRGEAPYIATVMAKERKSAPSTVATSKALPQAHPDSRRERARRGALCYDLDLGPLDLQQRRGKMW